MSVFETDSSRRFVPVAPWHISGIVNLLAGCYAEYGQILELDSLDGDLRCLRETYAPPHTFRVLLEEGRVVGTVAVKQTGLFEGELKRLFLDRRLRGRGLGRRMTEWSFDWARVRGIRILHIWTDATFRRAHGLYDRLGAERTGKRRVLGGRNEVEEIHFVKHVERKAGDER